MSANARPPVPPGGFLLGNAREFQADPLAALTRWSREHGDLFRLDVPFQDLYVVTHPDYIKTIIETESEKFRVGTPREQAFKGFGEDAIVLTDGEQWKRLRRVLQPYFTRQTVEDYERAVLEETDRLIDEWEAGQTVDLYETMSSLTIRTVSRSLMGIDLKGKEGPVKRAGDALVELADTRTIHANLPLWFPTPAALTYRRAKRDLYGLIDDLIDSTEPGSSHLLSHMVEAHEEGRLSRGETRENLVEFFLAGSDTSSAALTFTFFCLGNNPREKERVKTLARDEWSRDEFDPAAVREVEAFRFAVEEAMRIFPPGFTIARTADEEVEIGGYEFPEGAQFMCPQWVVHRDERFFEDPLEYRPERWENRDEWPDYAEFAFGGGDRYCIGSHFAMMEMPIILARILQRVDFEVLTETIEELKPSITLRPDHPVEMAVERTA